MACLTKKKRFTGKCLSILWCVCVEGGYWACAREIRLLRYHLETYKYTCTMDKRVAALRCSREFMRRLAMEHLMFVVFISVGYWNLSPERMLWTKERSNSWLEHVVHLHHKIGWRTFGCRSIPSCTCVTNYSPSSKRVILWWEKQCLLTCVLR